MGIPGKGAPWLVVDADTFRQKFRREWNEIQDSRLTAEEIDLLRTCVFARIVDNRANGISDHTADSAELWDIDRKLAGIRKNAL